MGVLGGLLGGGGSMSAPPIVSAPPPPPSVSQPNISATADQTRRKAAAQAGTILTSPKGLVSEGGSQPKTLTGS